MKTLCPPGYHHNGFNATHALGHMMYGYTWTHDVWRAQCFHDYIYITPILLLRDLSTLCITISVDHLRPLIYIYIYNLKSMHFM